MVFGAVAAAAVAGCSADGRTPQPTAPPGTSGVSPAGVTTRVDAPAASTEEEYFQACHAAKLWMQGQHGDPQSLIEPYLATLQRPGADGSGTWNTPWAKLSPARQAAVIVAVRAAANDECG
ncbi:hypothetical protein AWB95_11245 [Mycobacterium celatum]|uniref:LpqV protein n=1 Tax=Mycobacterium celatum TaxID=28045 RepID=A0A1X1RR82_MYCCE|nr:hypothetical protein AWB95_11245 [Mycobacterium celatum]